VLLFGWVYNYLPPVCRVVLVGYITICHLYDAVVLVGYITICHLYDAVVRVVGSVISKLLDRCDFKPCNGPCYFLILIIMIIIILTIMMIIIIIKSCMYRRLLKSHSYKVHIAYLYCGLLQQNKSNVHICLLTDTYTCTHTQETSVSLLSTG